MEMPNINLLSITPIYIALLGLLFFPMTLRVGGYRIKNNINIGDGGDAELIRRIRGHGNFVETVPIAIVMLVLMEILGASDTWLHALCALLLVGRMLHYVGLTEIGPFFCRPAGMFMTMAVYLVAPIWILMDVLG